MTTKQQAKIEAIEFLRKACPAGSRVYTTVTHVARSGMSRSIKVLIVDSTKEIRDVTGWVARALDLPLDYRRGGLRISGCGMDMCFHVVYELGRSLWPTWHCIGANCPSADHSNKPHPPRDGKMVHKDGGYSLRKESI